MKVKLEFNLPEEKNESELAQRGSDYFSIIFKTLQEIRSYLKYGHNFKSADEALQDIRNKLSEAHIEDID